MADATSELAALKAQLERERTLFSDGPVVVFRWRAVDGWPVEYVSSNVRHLFGWSAEEFLSGAVAYASTIHPDDLARVAREVQSHADAGDAHFEQDYRIVARDGTVRWLYDETAVMRDETGAATHFLGYVLDITARRQAEAAVREKDEQLLRAQKMEALGQLAGGVAHDFNNLLTAIAGHADLLARHLPEGSPGGASLDVIRSAIDRGAALTGQLLAFSRRQVLTPRVVDVNRSVAETLDLVGPLLGVGIRVVRALEPGPLPVRVDPSQLQQVLLNLALNARDAMPGGGTLTVRTFARTGAAGEGLAGPLVGLAVTDDGVGMAAETVARIYEPFFSTREGGTGLGLASVHGIVSQSGGRLEVVTRPGAGTTFEVLLPRDDAEPDRTPAPPAPRTVGGGRILLAEDQADLRDLMQEALRLNGYTVDAVGDGAQALERAGATAFDLVITDLSMPGTNGVDVAEGLVALGFRGPILFVSGHVGDLDLPPGPRRAFLRKPFGIGALPSSSRRDGGPRDARLLIAFVALEQPWPTFARSAPSAPETTWPGP